MARPNVGDTTLIFGIDFGTTFSGVSWAWSGQHANIRSITGWPNPVLPGQTELVKAPTVIRYPSAQPAPASTADGCAKSITAAETKWGYSVPPGDDSIRWFKLLLLDEDDMKQYLSTVAMSHLAKMRKNIEASGKEVLDIIADYLRLLWNHTIEKVESHLTAGTVARTTFKVVVTVPAIWKGYVRSRMRLAVQRAGILDARTCPEDSDQAPGPTTLCFISEPEAAALASLTDLHKTRSLKLGDCITVADFGGGTVDVISYEVTNEQKFAVSEVVEGKGGLCGAIFLDEAFRNLWAQKVGIERFNMIPDDEVAQFLDSQWEHGLKRLYIRNRQYIFHLMGSHVRVTGEEKIKINKDELLGFFTLSPVIYGAIALVKEQVRLVKEKTGKFPKYVAMVGGFGASMFLKFELESSLWSGIEILQGTPNDTWSSISRGAVISAAKGLLDDEFAEVTARIARANYGFCGDQHWNSAVHDERDKYWCDKMGAYLASRQMTWFLKRGDRSSQEDPHRYDCYHMFRETDREGYPNLSASLFTYRDYNPPQRWGSGVTELAPVAYTAPTPFEQLPYFVNHIGEKIKYANWIYEARCFGDSLDLVVTTQSDKTTLGMKNYDIDVEADRPSGAAGSPSSGREIEVELPPPAEPLPSDGKANAALSKPPALPENLTKELVLPELEQTESPPPPVAELSASPSDDQAAPAERAGAEPEALESEGSALEQVLQQEGTDTGPPPTYTPYSSGWVKPIEPPAVTGTTTEPLSSSASEAPTASESDSTSAPAASDTPPSGRETPVPGATSPNGKFNLVNRSSSLLGTIGGSNTQSALGRKALKRFSSMFDKKKDRRDE